MKILTVRVKSGQGRAQDRVFQSVRDGKPIRDNNILTRLWSLRQGSWVLAG